MTSFGVWNSSRLRGRPLRRCLRLGLEGVGGKAAPQYRMSEGDPAVEAGVCATNAQGQPA
jgi:hypothetical protein